MLLVKVVKVFCCKACEAGIDGVAYVNGDFGVDGVDG